MVFTGCRMDLAWWRHAWITRTEYCLQPSRRPQRRRAGHPWAIGDLTQSQLLQCSLRTRNARTQQALKFRKAKSGMLPAHWRQRPLCSSLGTAIPGAPLAQHTGLCSCWLPGLEGTSVLCDDPWALQPALPKSFHSLSMKFFFFFFGSVERSCQMPGP